MARVYLDTNILIDLTEKRGNKFLANNLDQHTVCISPLSIHVLFYSYKKKIPDQNSNEIFANIKIIDFTQNILLKSLQGPTGDLEDNIQLHSAAEADCNYYLTADASLLKMRFFGKTKIVSSLRIS
mgnify:CR=1 FL=1